MPNSVLEVTNLTKTFQSKKTTFTAVNNLSFTINEGEIFGLLGPNGAGKTTTIYMLLGVMEESSGTIRYFGKDFKKHREEILKETNYSSSYISLPWNFTVSEIMEVFARLYEVPNRKKRIQKLLAEFEIEDLTKKQFYMLSAGQKTRVLLTKAFLNYPKIILLDEPTASLDVEIAVKIREFLKKEQKEYNVSMLLTSHNMAEVEEMCDRVLILKDGTKVIEDTPEILAKKVTVCTVELRIPDAKKALEFLKEKHFVFQQKGSRFYIAIDEQNIADLLKMLVEEKITYDEISIDKPDLEDFFLQTIQEEKNES